MQGDKQEIMGCCTLITATGSVRSRWSSLDFQRWIFLKMFCHGRVNSFDTSSAPDPSNRNISDDTSKKLFTFLKELSNPVPLSQLECCIWWIAHGNQIFQLIQPEVFRQRVLQGTVFMKKLATLALNRHSMIALVVNGQPLKKKIYRY